jgi:hypothetical protein
MYRGVHLSGAAVHINTNNTRISVHHEKVIKLVHNI